MEQDVKGMVCTSSYFCIGDGLRNSHPTWPHRAFASAAHALCSTSFALQITAAELSEYKSGDIGMELREAEIVSRCSKPALELLLLTNAAVIRISALTAGITTLLGPRLL